jgi:hypothetical protein
MLRPIPQPSRCSSESAPLVLEARRSRAAAAAHLALHAILAAAALATALPAWGRVAALAALAAHATLRWPTAPPPLAMWPDGVVEVAGCPYTLGPGTTYTAAWIRLSLVDAARRRREIVLVRDQVDAARWSRLQAWLRNPR